MNVTIVGLGLIGGSLAIDLRAEGFARVITGVDLNDEHVQQARSRGLCDDIADLDRALVDADLVILAVPVNSILQMLPKVLDKIGGRTTVTDMGSTKEAMCRAVANHPKRKQYVASHPMAGTEFSGPLAALRGLFAGRTTVICEAELSEARDLRRIDEMYDALKMNKFYMSPQEHDLHAAYVSHLSHISSFVLANTVLDKERDTGTIFNLAGGGFESTVRLAKSSPLMWSPIFEQNRQNVLVALDAYMVHLEAFRSSLRSSLPTQTTELMKSANKIGEVLQKIGHAKQVSGTKLNTRGAK